MCIVNDYFKKFYPEDANSAWTMRQCVESYGREYEGKDSAARIFPEMVCADGFEMSVQGHFGAYSSPRGDFEPHYLSVEVSTAPRAEPLFESHGGHTYDGFSIYGYVPVELVAKVIERHGGLASSVTQDQR